MTGTPPAGEKRGLVPGVRRCLHLSQGGVSCDAAVSSYQGRRSAPGRLCPDPYQVTRRIPGAGTTAALLRRSLAPGACAVPHGGLYTPPPDLSPHTTRMCMRRALYMYAYSPQRCTPRWRSVPMLRCAQESLRPAGRAGESTRSGAPGVDAPMDLGGHQAGHLWLALHVQGGPARSRQTWGLVVTGALAAPQRGAGAHHPETPGPGAHCEGTRRAHPGWRSLAPLWNLRGRCIKKHTGDASSSYKRACSRHTASPQRQA